MTDVFISYSRKDKEFVQSLNTTLDKINRKTWVDWDNIPLSADWWREIQEGIEASETFIFIITPSSVESEVCQKEINYAVKLNKRLVPVIRADSIDIHPTLSKLNWLYFREEDNFEEAFLSLIRTLDTDLNHVRTHTRLLRRAIEWNNKGMNNDLLLRGRDFEDAKEWLDNSLKQNKNPTPSVVTTEYIEASKLNYERLKKEEQYNSLKNETLKEYVHAYLEEQKQSSERRIKRIEDERIAKIGHSPGHISFEEVDMWSELEVVKNLLGEKARWHPQSAVEDGVTIGYEGFPQYKFPCCQKKVALSVSSPGPSQFRKDGCEWAPLSI